LSISRFLRLRLKFGTILALPFRAEITPNRLHETARRAPACDYRNTLNLSLISITFHGIMVQKVGEQNKKIGITRERRHGTLVGRRPSGHMPPDLDSKPGK